MLPRNDSANSLQEQITTEKRINEALKASLNEVKRQVKIENFVITNFDFASMYTVNFNKAIKKSSRIPKQIFTDATITNDVMPNEIWIKIFSFLSVKDLICLIVSCKTMMNAANDDDIRGRLYKAKHNYHLFKFSPSSCLEYPSNHEKTQKSQLIKNTWLNKNF